MKYCIFIISIAIVACTGSSTFTSAEKETVVKETKQMLYDYYKDIKASGLTAEFKYLDHSADFFWQHLAMQQCFLTTLLKKL